MKHIKLLGALLVLQSSVLWAQKEIHILSVNDIHAAIDNFPKFAAVADSLRSLYPDLIVLSAGDNRTGNPVNDKHAEPSRPVTDMMNAVGFTASAVGNHEFDSKISGFRTQINNSNFQYLCANIFLPDSMRTHIFPYKILDNNGVVVGILGTIQVNSSGIPDSHPNNLVNITFRHPNEVINNYQWMRNQCDVMVLLSHDGYETDKQTADKYPFLDVIVGGHSHTFIKDGEIVNGVLVTQSKNKLRYATHITLKVVDKKVVDKKAETLDVEHFSKENSNVRALVNYYNENTSLSQTVATIECDFSNSEELGNMECDALSEETGADIALQNGGGVRISNFKAGNMTLKDIYSLDPFGNMAVVYQLTGKEIEDFIMNNYDIDEHQTPFVSGIEYVMKVDAKTRKPKSIKIKFLDGRKFNQKEKYKFVTNSYVASTSTSQKADKGSSLNVSCSDLLLRWMQKKQKICYNGSHRATVIAE